MFLLFFVNNTFISKYSCLQLMDQNGTKTDDSEKFEQTHLKLQEAEKSLSLCKKSYKHTKTC